MNDLPRGTPDPPPSGGAGPLSPGESGERPMSMPAAGGWVAGVTFLFLWLLGIIATFRPDERLDVISSFGCQAVAYLLGLFGVLQIHAPRASIRELLGVRRTHAAFYPIAIALGVALEGPIAAVYDAIERRWPSGVSERELVKIFAEASALELAALGAVFIALGPAVEEIFFRGALVRPLRQRYAAPLVIAATSALFAVAHIEWQKFLPIAIFGVFLGVLRVASGSLLPPVLLHATYNAIQCYALLTVAAADPAGEAAAAPPAGAPAPAWVVAASSACALVLVALAIALGNRAEAAVRAREKDAP
ncbi:CPBP family intramembrane glutamic endopeptidase [Sorangium sp. So ce131]|uniref:CPBP family intramembrane glutamic endopeptidase n=1 Tax=Sorangium sp. So ce131 TaxID=3133282 RepID=UPI003F5FDF55